MLKLNTIGKNIQRNGKTLAATVVGVVVDITKPVHRQKEGNYIQMVKIIDESLNDKHLFGIMSRQCCVYIISKKNETDFLKGIGDIVVLDKFPFTVWNDIKLQAKYGGTTQGLYQVSVSTTNLNVEISHFLSVNPQLFELTEAIKDRVREVFTWSRSDLSKFFMPSLGVSILHNHYVKIDPFNLILKFKSSKKNRKSYLLELEDRNDNTFYLQYYHEQFQNNSLLYIRGIKNIGPSFQIQLSETGKVLQIQEDFAYIEAMNYVAIFKDKEKFIKEQKNNSFTLLEHQSLQPTYLQTLLELKDRYDHSNNKDKIQTQDNYLIEAIAVGYEGKVHLYHKDYQILLHKSFYNQTNIEQRRQLINSNKIRFIYEGTLVLIDRSLQKSAKTLDINLFTCDERGTIIEQQQISDFEKGIGKKEEESQRLKYEQVIHKKFDRIVNESNFQEPVLIVVEPIKSEKLFYRVVNTIFV